MRMQGYYENHHDDRPDAFAWQKQNDHCTPHFHHSVELVYVVSGSIRATLDGATYDVTAGTLLINASYTVHSYETPVSSRSIIVILPVGQLPSARQQLRGRAFAAHLCPDDDAGTLGTLVRMLAENPGSPLVRKGLAYTLLGLLIDRVGLVDAPENTRTAFIRDVLEYLQQHHTEPLSAGQIAAHFGYSRSRFSHIFNAQLGYTLSDYLGALRCRHAAQLLRETDMPVSDIAMQVGFESLRTFYRAFKKQYDMTPNTYARA